MTTITYIFWISFGLLLYTYFGYGLVMMGIARFRRLFRRGCQLQIKQESPALSLIVVVPAASLCLIKRKWNNCLGLSYPGKRIAFIFASQDINDESDRWLSGQEEIRHIRLQAGSSPSEMVNEAMKAVRTPIVVFTEVGSLLEPAALERVVAAYDHYSVGAVSGEKSIWQEAERSILQPASELWKRYDDWLNVSEASVNTTLNAGGLFSIRTSLFEPIPADTMLHELAMVFGISSKGFKVNYLPDSGLRSVFSGLHKPVQRLWREAEGQFQLLGRFWRLLNVNRFGILSLQFFSHCVLRWFLAPLSLLLMVPSLCFLALSQGGLYSGMLAMIALVSIFIAIPPRRMKHSWQQLAYYWLLTQLCLLCASWYFLTGRRFPSLRSRWFELQLNLAAERIDRK